MQESDPSSPSKLRAIKEEVLKNEKRKWQGSKGRPRGRCFFHRFFQGGQNGGEKLRITAAHGQTLMFEDLFSHVVCDLVYRQVFVQHPKQRPTDSDGFVLGNRDQMIPGKVWRGMMDLVSTKRWNDPKKVVERIGFGSSDLLLKWPCELDEESCVWLIVENVEMGDPHPHSVIQVMPSVSSWPAGETFTPEARNHEFRTRTPCLFLGVPLMFETHLQQMSLKQYWCRWLLGQDMLSVCPWGHCSRDKCHLRHVVAGSDLDRTLWYVGIQWSPTSFLGWA